MASATFEVRKFRDIEVVVNVADEKRPINLTKLTASLTGSRYSFRHLSESKSFWKLISSYTGLKLSEFSSGGKPTDDETGLQELFDKGVLVRVVGGRNAAVRGTYGPTWLADWIIFSMSL